MHGNQPNTFEIGQRMNSDFLKKIMMEATITRSSPESETTFKHRKYDKVCKVRPLRGAGFPRC